MNLLMRMRKRIVDRSATGKKERGEGKRRLMGLQKKKEEIVRHWGKEGGEI